VRIRTWQVQTAKNRFSELINEAQKGRPQLVTRNGKAAVYVIDSATFERTVGAAIPDKKHVLMRRPHKEIELETPRTRSDTGRPVEV